VSFFPFLIASYTSIVSVANPFGAMPVFLALTQSDTKKQRNSQVLKASLYMVVILTVFFVAGNYIMRFFGISLNGIRIAGGLLIMQVSFYMLHPKKERGGNKLSDEDVDEAIDKEDISFSPLAMPMLSGPGSIAVVLGLSSSANDFMDYLVIFIAILLTAGTAYVVLRVSPWAVKYLGKSGMTALTRMMGFIGLCIGVQFIINGISALIR